MWAVDIGWFQLDFKIQLLTYFHNLLICNLVTRFTDTTSKKSGNVDGSIAPPRPLRFLCRQLYLAVGPPPPEELHYRNKWNLRAQRLLPQLSSLVSDLMEVTKFFEKDSSKRIDCRANLIAPASPFSPAVEPWGCAASSLTPCWPRSTRTRWGWCAFPCTCCILGLSRSCWTLVWIDAMASRRAARAVCCSSLAVLFLGGPVLHCSL